MEWINRVGPIVAKSVPDWFDDADNAAIWRISSNHKNQKLMFRFPVRPDFQEKSTVLTGALKSLTREEAKENIRKMGGKVSSSVSSSTDYVVTGRDAGLKWRKGERARVKIFGKGK